MRLVSVEQYGVTITFSKEDCALLAYMLNTALLHEGYNLDRLPLGRWIEAAEAVFEAGALLSDAGSIILDTVRTVSLADQAGFNVEAIRRRAALLAAPGPRLEV